MSDLNSPSDESNEQWPTSEEEELWTPIDAQAWIAAQVAQDPALGAMQDAMAHAASQNLGIFEIFLAGEVADAAALGTGEREWLNTALSGDNKLVQGALRGEGVMHSPASTERLNQAIGNLKGHGLWPW